MGGRKLFHVCSVKSAGSRQDLDDARAAFEAAQAHLTVNQQALRLQVIGSRREAITEAAARLDGSRAFGMVLRMISLEALEQLTVNARPPGNPHRACWARSAEAAIWRGDAAKRQPTTLRRLQALRTIRDAALLANGP